MHANDLIYGFKDSTAQSYAKTTGAKFVAIVDETTLLGDVDGDGKIALNDAYKVLLAYSKESVGLSSDLTSVQISAADIDDDGKISLDDSYKILLYYATESVGKNGSWD